MTTSKRLPHGSPVQSQSSATKLFAILIAAFMFICLSMNIAYERMAKGSDQVHSSPLSRASEYFKAVGSSQITNKEDIQIRGESRTDGESTIDKKDQHEISGLTCDAYGGPSDEIASEMVYWSDIPSDSKHVSPFQKKDGKTGVQYMTFEPDGGGWNNIRMAMETVVLMAHAMGRTLVLPPAQRMYLLGKDRDKQNTYFTFADFFHLDSLDVEHEGIDIITTEEFLLREAMSGNLRNKTSGEVSFPPYNRTNWDGSDNQAIIELKEWLREVTIVPIWRPKDCVAAFPASANSEAIDDLENILNQSLIKVKDFPAFMDNPPSVDAAPSDRLSEVLSNRKELCIYDEQLQNEPVLHFMCYHKMRVRLLTHYYSFLFFEDWKQQLWAHRFVRDHLRYLDELQCAAARIVNAIKERAKKRDPEGNGEGYFDSFHIRRGDFQFKATRVDASVLYNQTKELIPENSTIYIATDERNKGFFDIFREHYDICFLDDFKELIIDMNTNHYGMLDQLIASKGRTFVGTYWSTFTGYINRMRGYHSTKDKQNGWEKGILDSYYFVPEEHKHAMRKYATLKGPSFAREFPIAWRDIDKGINEL